MIRSALLLCLFSLTACHQAPLWLGELPDSGSDAVPDSGQPASDAGNDAGTDAGTDAGIDAGLPPFDDTAALLTCARVDACLSGADFGNGIRGAWFPMCVQTLASPMPTAEELKQYSSLGSTLSAWFLPTPLWLVFPGVRECLATAQTCDAVVSCFNFGTPPPVCNDINGTVKCNGSVMTVCTAPSANYAYASFPAPATLHAFSVDCATTGGTCVPPLSPAQQGPVGCAAGPCTGSFQRCDDSEHMATCANGRLDVTTCAGGTHCTVDGAGNAGCVSSASCDATTFGGACASPGAVTSCLGGQLLTLGCQAGTTCQVSPGGTAFCGVAAECAPIDEIPLCESGGALKVCSFGRWKTVRCADVGFTTCHPADLTLRHGAVCG